MGTHRYNPLQKPCDRRRHGDGRCRSLEAGCSRSVETKRRTLAALGLGGLLRRLRGRTARLPPGEPRVRRSSRPSSRSRTHRHRHPASSRTHNCAALGGRTVRLPRRLFFVDGPRGPRGFCQRHGKSYLIRRRRGGGGRRGRLADRPRYSISVSLGVVPLVLPRRGSPSTHRGQGETVSARRSRSGVRTARLD